MKIIRTCIFLGSLLVFVGLLSQYATLPNTLAKQFAPSHEVALEQAIASLSSRDPNAANALRSLKDDRSRRAIEAALREQKNLPNGDFIGNAEAIARNLSDQKDSLATHRYELAKIAGDSELLRTQAERDSFVVAHGTALDTLASLQAVPEGGKAIAEESVAEYLARLRHATNQPAVFRRIAADPIGMMLFEEISDEAIRDFYLRLNEDPTHPDWLKDVIVARVQGAARTESPIRLTSFVSKPEDQSVEPPALTVGDVVRVAYENHPIFQQSIFDDLSLSQGERRPPAVVVSLFQEYGPIIRMAVGPGGNVPRSEILDVIFANEDFIEDAQDRDGRDAPATLAAHFAFLQKSKPGVWREARYSPLALRLEQEAPDDANLVLEKYGPDDIATLLFTGYEDSIEKATKSVAQFGDLAIVVLQMYSDEEGGSSGLFHRALKNPKIGTRIVPFVASKGDEGLLQVESNIGWLDKYFKEDGTPREESWLEAIPFVGGPANVVKNMVNRHPNEWSELGWAAVDVADVGLLVVTFGGSASKQPAQVAAKQAAKAAVRQSAKEVAKRAPRAMATRAAARAARSQLGMSLLRAGRVVGRTAAIAGRVFTRVWKVFTYVMGASYKAILTVLDKANDLRKAWGSVPQSIRRSVYGGLLAATLYVRVKYKTLPLLPQLAEEMGRFIGSVVHQTGKSLAVAFAGFVDEVLGGVLSQLGRFAGLAVYLGTLAVCLIIAWKTHPFGRRRYRYA